MENINGKRWHQPLSPVPAVSIVMGVMLLIGISIGSAELIKEYGQRRWLGQERYTRIEVKNSPIIIESIDPATGKGFRLKLPDNLVIKTAGGRGQWQVKALPALEKKFGNWWAAISVADSLGIGLTEGDGKLNIWDKWSWIRMQHSIEWQDIDMEKMGLTVPAKEVDGADTQKLSDEWDEKATELFSSDLFLKQKWRVSVTNTVDTEGLGKQAAATIEHAGLKVVLLSSSDGNLDKCQVESRNDNLDKTAVVWVAKAFDCVVTGRESLAEDEIGVKIGNDYRSRINGN